MNREILAEQFGEELMFLDPAEQFDSCIVGIAHRCGMDPLVAYDQAKVINALIDSGMSQEDAFEWFDVNILGAYVGERTPIFVEITEADKC
jgi:hypothetical protein